MKQTLSKILIIVVGIFSFSGLTQAADTYKIDSSHTYVLWHISHFGFSNPSGKWTAEGTLILDEAKPQNSKVNVTIPVSKMITGDPELDKHLNGKTFFDTAQYPTATFVSDKVDVRNKKMAKVHGTLTLHGISKPITLYVTLNKIGINPIKNKKTAGFSAKAELKRSDFDMNTLLPGLGDKVKLDIEVEAVKEE